MFFISPRIIRFYENEIQERLLHSGYVLYLLKPPSCKLLRRSNSKLNFEAMRILKPEMRIKLNKWFAEWTSKLLKYHSSFTWQSSQNTDMLHCIWLHGTCLKENCRGTVLVNMQNCFLASELVFCMILQQVIFGSETGSTHENVGQKPTENSPA